MVSDTVTNMPWIGGLIGRSLEAIVSVINDITQMTVNSQAIFSDFREAGYPVEKREDIGELDLEAVDLTSNQLVAKYKGVISTGGIVTGLMGAPGHVLDVPALIVSALRAVGEYATYYGFDLNNQQERVYALLLIHCASCSEASARIEAMNQLDKFLEDMACDHPILDEQQKSLMLQGLAKSICVRLVKGKLAQSIPIAGSVMGTAFNDDYISKVCEVASYFYSECFLERKRLKDIEVSR